MCGKYLKLDLHLSSSLISEIFLRAGASVSIFATRKTSIISLDLFVKLVFLRKVIRLGLVSFHLAFLQGFIFELTDLYEKKNLPKVIYCIHALRYVSILCVVRLSNYG